MGNYTTVSDVIADQITPALDGVFTAEQIARFAQHLRETGFIAYTPNGFVLLLDPDGFWVKVEAYFEN